MSWSQANGLNKRYATKEATFNPIGHYPLGQFSESFASTSFYHVFKVHATKKKIIVLPLIETITIKRSLFIARMCVLV